MFKQITLISFNMLIFCLSACGSDRKSNSAEDTTDAIQDPLTGGSAKKSKGPTVTFIETQPYPCGQEVFGNIVYLKESGFLVCTERSSWEPINLKGDAGAEGSPGPQGPRGMDATDENRLNDTPKAKSAISIDIFTFIGALNYCSNLSENSLSDWRLPTWREAFYYVLEIPVDYYWTRDFSPYSGGNRAPIYMNVSPTSVGFIVSNSTNQNKVFCVR